MNILLLFVGLIGSIFFYSSISQANQTNKWVITSANLDLLETPSYKKMINQTYREFKTINVNYSYTYKNQKYSSSQLSLVSLGTLRSHQIDALISEKGWKEGNTISIYVNPYNPFQATMLKGTKGVGKDTWISFYFCLLLMLSGLVGFLRTLFDLLSNETYEIES